jgi:hypothetical protein
MLLPVSFSKKFNFSNLMKIYGTECLRGRVSLSRQGEERLYVVRFPRLLIFRSRFSEMWLCVAWKVDNNLRRKLLLYAANNKILEYLVTHSSSSKVSEVPSASFFKQNLLWFTCCLILEVTTFRRNLLPLSSSSNVSKYFCYLILQATTFQMNLLPRFSNTNAL